MKTRIISAAVGVVLCIALLILGEINSVVLTVSISLVSALLCGELLSAKKLHKNFKLSAPCIAFAALMPALSYTSLRFFPLYLFSLAVFILMIVFHKTLNFDDVMFAYGGSLLITLSMTSFVIVVCSQNKFTAFWAVLVLVVPWFSDSGAYFSGTFFGKKKLCPEISPKKTVEGAAGGILCGILGAILCGAVFLLIYKAQKVSVNFLMLAVIGVVNSVVSIFGDLTFSVIKRHCGIKDYGSIMPGHGGALDRFDSVLFCAPFVFILSQLVTIIS